MIKHQKPNTDSNQWIHAVFVIQNRSIQSVKMYRNGLLQEACFASPDIYPMQTTAQNPITFGVSHDLTIAQPGYFKGNLDDIAIWNRQLSDAEILQLYTDTKAGLEENETYQYLFPNPTNNYIYLPEIKPLDSIQIRDLSGRAIETFEIENGNKIKFEELKKGIYFIQTKTNRYRFIVE